MAWYEVEMVGEVREVYLIEADDEHEAAQRWYDGTLAVSEAYGMELRNVRDAPA